jgi:ATP-dependent protease Clp ATPase subunit
MMGASVQMLERQIIALAARNAELLMALEDIAKKRKLDAVAASSMRSIARSALKDVGFLIPSQDRQEAK